MRRSFGSKRASTVACLKQQHWAEKNAGTSNILVYVSTFMHVIRQKHWHI